MERPWWTLMAVTAEEKDLILFGLYMRKNYIQTGDPLMSAQDAVNMGKKKKIKVLGDDQIELLKKLNDLIRKIENTL